MTFIILVWASILLAILAAAMYIEISAKRTIRALRKDTETEKEEKENLQKTVEIVRGYIEDQRQALDEWGKQQAKEQKQFENMMNYNGKAQGDDYDGR